jgi:hypothetical protein
MLAFTLDCLFSVQLINQCFGGYSAETPTQQGQRLGYKPRVFFTFECRD